MNGVARRTRAMRRPREASMFEPVTSHFDAKRLEQEVLRFWKERDIFHRSLDNRRGNPEWVFFEGPPTANGRPGVHHVLARAFKDLFPRYRTMRGFHVRRRAGWDTHGLPVEIEVEKELGFSGKDQIEAYGIEKFNARCRELGLPLHPGLGEAHGAHRLLGGSRRGLRHLHQRLHRIGLVDSQTTLGARPAVSGFQGRPLLPSLRHAAF